MKKIVALVLVLVLALSLATVAFAANPSVTAKAYKDTANGTLVVGDKAATFFDAVAATVVDGKQTNTADIGHYTFNEENCVVADSLADADYVLYSDVDGKNVMMYLKVAVTSYAGNGVVFTNFGDKCGQVKFTPVAGKTYYTTTAKGDTSIYVADAEGAKALMVDGKLVNVAVAAVSDTAFAKKHVAVPTVKDGKVVGYTCADCKLAAVEAANFMSIPEDAQQIAGNWYFPAAAAATTTTGVSSAKTFDAGVALYAGMALMSVAGSAVVIGKKKEF